MTVSSTALVSTASGKRYAAQLGKHWAHNLTVIENGTARRVVFPRDARGADWPGDGSVDLIPGDETLECRIQASVHDQLDALKGVVERHIDRFAFREGPLKYDWQDV